MILLSWNCWGLGTLCKHRDLSFSEGKSSHRSVSYGDKTNSRRDETNSIGLAVFRHACSPLCAKGRWFGHALEGGRGGFTCPNVLNEPGAEGGGGEGGHLPPQKFQMSQPPDYHG